MKEKKWREDSLLQDMSKRFHTQHKQDNKEENG